jgi:hypothetical protein
MQELIFLHCKKQNLNRTLYTLHLQCSQYYVGMWQCLEQSINNHLHSLMDITYHTLNKKLDILQTRQPKQTTNHPSNLSHIHHNQIINLSNIHFTTEQMNTMSLGLKFAIE